jgi:hypothetical protein
VFTALQYVAVAVATVAIVVAVAWWVALLVNRTASSGAFDAEERHEHRRRAVLLAVLMLGVVASVAASLQAGVPKKLPGAALGSEVLLHAGRVTALFVAFLLIVTVLWRGSEGHLPSELSGKGVKYEEVKELHERTLDELATAVEALGEQMAEATTAVADLGVAVEHLRARLEELGT